MSRFFVCAVAIVGALVLPAICAADCGDGIPDIELSTVTIVTPGATLFNRVNGQGDPFTAARLDGAVVDATVTLTLVDVCDGIIVGYPAEDLWLETSGGGLVPCLEGTIADGPTDENGQALWQHPLRAGGSSVGETVGVNVAGSPVGVPGLELTFVSADITGDLHIDLADLTLFTTAYVGGFDPRADLFSDNILNLSDFSLFAVSYGDACP